MSARDQGLGPSLSSALVPELGAASGHRHCGEKPAARVPAGTPFSLEHWGLGAHGSLGSQLLPLVSVLLKFRVHDFECGQEIAQEEDEERERQHEHLGRGTQGDQGRGGRGRSGKEKVEPAPISSLLRCPPFPPFPCPRNPLSTSHQQTAVFPQQKAEIWANCVKGVNPQGHAGPRRAPPLAPP